MHSINLVFGPAATTWRLLFKTEDAAKLVHGILERRTGELTRVQDDFGQVLSLKTPIHAMMLEDLDQVKLANIEMAMHNARSQSEAQARAAADPKLRASAAGRGPGILSPIPNGQWPS